MSDHQKTFQLRLDVDYTESGQVMSAYKYDTETNQWKALPIGENTPGLLLFLYSVLSCQRLFLQKGAQSAELGLTRIEAELRARFDKSRFCFLSIETRFQARVQKLPDQSVHDHIHDVMIHCPVSSNLDKAINHPLQLDFLPT